MKKQFPLTHPKKAPARQLEAVKGEVNKYLKRERRKTLPEDFDFWGFDCRCGSSESEASPVHVAELPKQLDTLHADGAAECFVEILAKPVKRQTKPDSKAS